MQGKTRALWELTRGERRLYGSAIAVLFVGVVLLYGPPLVVRAVIDGLIRADVHVHEEGLVIRALRSVATRTSLAMALTFAGLSIFLMTGLSGVFMYLKGRWSAMASERIVKRLRERLYDHLQHLPASYHDKAQTGDLVQRCTSDVETVRLFYNTQVVEIARAIILLVSVLPIVLMLDWPLGLTAIAMMPIIVVFAVVFFRKAQGAFKAMDEAEGAMTTTLQENLTGIRVVRAFARQAFEKEKFEKRNRAHRDLHYRLYVVLAYFWAFSDFMCFAQTGLVLVVGAYRVAMGYSTVGTLVAFISYVALVIWPVRQMGRILSELGKAMVSIGRIHEILESPEESESAEQSAPTATIRGEVRFKDVSFSHGATSILHGVNFHIPAGQTLAILGPSGSGKSTIIHLLLRLYDLESGSIQFDGTDIRQMPRKFVRRQIAVVMQEPFLYSKTIRQNIALAQPNASHEEVVESARMAAIHESIESFEKQYDTLVGERGVTLSGGQRQRVAIARALVRDAPILVLDDALSAVDTRTEVAILDALRRRRGKHTTILIAHRLSTVMHADQIIVLDHGRIVQVGTHEQLIAAPGLYQKLWQIQGALEEDLTEEMRRDDDVAVNQTA